VPMSKIYTALCLHGKKKKKSGFSYARFNDEF
jgi:hypothetical protein